MIDLSTIASIVGPIVFGGAAGGGAYKKREYIAKLANQAFRILQKQLGLIDQTALVILHLEDEVQEAQAHLVKIQAKLEKLRAHKAEIESQLAVNQQEEVSAGCFRILQDYFHNQAEGAQAALIAVDALIRQAEAEEIIARATFNQAHDNLRDIRAGRVIEATPREEQNEDNEGNADNFETEIAEDIIDAEKTLVEVGKWKLQAQMRIDKINEKLRSFKEYRKTASETNAEIVNKAIRDEKQKVEARQTSAIQLQARASEVEEYFQKITNLIRAIRSKQEDNQSAEELIEELTKLKKDGHEARMIARDLSQQIIKITIKEAFKDLSLINYIKNNLLEIKVIPYLENEFSDTDNSEIIGLINNLKQIVKLRKEIRDLGEDKDRREEIKAEIAALNSVKQIIEQLLVFKHFKVIEQLTKEFEGREEYQQDITELQRLSEQELNANNIKLIYKIKKKIQIQEEIKKEREDFIDKVQNLIDSIKEGGAHGEYLRGQLLKMQNDVRNGDTPAERRIEYELIMKQVKAGLAKRSSHKLVASEEKVETKESEENDNSEQRRQDSDDSDYDIANEYNIANMIRGFFNFGDGYDSLSYNVRVDIPYNIMSDIFKFGKNNYLDPLSDSYKKIIQEAHRFNVGEFFDFTSMNPFASDPASSEQELDPSSVVKNSFYIDDYGHVVSVLGVMMLYMQVQS